MAGHYIIGLVLILTGALISYGMMRFSFIRDNAVMKVTVCLNPGLVGFLAGSAFITHVSAPEISKPLLYAALALIVFTLPVVTIFLPKTVIEENAKKLQAEDNAESDDK